MSEALDLEYNFQRPAYQVSQSVLKDQKSLAFMNSYYLILEACSAATLLSLTLGPEMPKQQHVNQAATHLSKIVYHVGVLMHLMNVGEDVFEFNDVAEHAEEMPPIYSMDGGLAVNVIIGALADVCEIFFEEDASIAMGTVEDPVGPTEVTPVEGEMTPEEETEQCLVNILACTILLADRFGLAYKSVIEYTANFRAYPVSSLINHSSKPAKGAA
jgi:hypothetical protein